MPNMLWVVFGLFISGHPASVLQDRDIYRDVISLTHRQIATEPDPTGERDLPKKTVKILVHYARAADISEALGGAVLDFGRTRAEEETTRWNSNNTGAANLLPSGIDSLIAHVDDNTLITRYDNEDALRELVEIVRGLDIRPRTLQVNAEAELLFTDRSGKQTRSVLTAQGATTSERRLHLKSRKEDAAPLLVQTSDVDIYARLLDDGTVSVAADWYLNVTVAGVAKGARSSASNVYRTEAVTSAGKSVTVTHAFLTFTSGKVEVTLKLTPRMIDPGATHDGRPLFTPSR